MVDREVWARWSDGMGGTFTAGRLIPESGSLSIVCPRCRAAKGGKCLDKTLWGSKYIEEPHPERVQAAAGK